MSGHYGRIGPQPTSSLLNIVNTRLARLLCSKPRQDECPTSTDIGPHEGKKHIAPIDGSLLTPIQVRCQIFSTTFNPEGIRTGNKILRQRLKGPALASYYPPKVATVRDLIKEFKQYELLTDDEEQEDRLEHLAGYVAQAPKGRGRLGLTYLVQVEVAWQRSTEEEEGTPCPSG